MALMQSDYSYMTVGLFAVDYCRIARSACDRQYRCLV